MSDSLVPRKSTALARGASPEEMTARALQLTPRERSQVMSAFNAENYEMASTFIWTRAMGGLKKQLSSLGMPFLGELLERPDIKAHDSVTNVITDYEAVRLAEELGMFGGTEAMRLRHAMELVAHFAEAAEEDDEREMMVEEARAVLRACVQSVLRHEGMSGVMSFVEFRKGLEEASFKEDDPKIQKLMASAPFFRRTALRVLLAAVRTQTGPFLSYALSNLDLLIKLLWKELPKPDRWMVGRTYAELHNDGNKAASAALGKSLVAVGGFDFVPENLRSVTFVHAAVRVLNAHHAHDNFYNEPEPMKLLAQLGTGIPQPALAQCVTATLCVRLGNFWGESHAAQDSAKSLLDNLKKDAWKYYLEECLPADTEILRKLEQPKPRARWKSMVVSAYDLDEQGVSVPLVQALLQASATGEDKKLLAAVAALQKARYGTADE